MKTPEPCLQSYIYYAREKLRVLFHQLPESRRIAQKETHSHTAHPELDFAPHGKKTEEQELACFPWQLSHWGLSHTRYRLCEALFDPNDMYQLQRVMQSLQKTGQLCPWGATPHKPGCYYHIKGAFKPEAEAEAPSGYLWLSDPAQHLRLLCWQPNFFAESESTGSNEFFACNEALLLCGVALCLHQTKEFCGLPLFLRLPS